MDLPYKMVIFHSYVAVYQRVILGHASNCSTCDILRQRVEDTQMICILPTLGDQDPSMHLATTGHGYYGRFLWFHQGWISCAFIIDGFSNKPWWVFIATTNHSINMYKPTKIIKPSGSLLGSAVLVAREYIEFMQI